MDQVVSPPSVTKSVYDQCQDNQDYSTLVENIDNVGMSDYIDRDLPLTFLTPNNKAWRRVAFGALEGVAILQRHLFRGLLFCDVLANETTITSVSGETLGVEKRGETMWVGGVAITECDILARNGIIHYVDRVIGLDYDTVAPTTSPAPTITGQPTISVPPTPGEPTFLQQTPAPFPTIKRTPVYQTAKPHSTPGSNGNGNPGSAASGPSLFLVSVVASLLAVWGVVV
jgi:hypothetical protein